MKPTISVTIPALNEEKNIQFTVENVISAITNKFSDYELLIFDDCSTDNTGIITDELSKKNEKIKVIHNPKTMGFGYNYRKGVELAQYDYISMIPGDNEISSDSINEMFSLVAKADIVIPYTVNYWIRPLTRQIISRLFTVFMNFLFGLNLKYYNGPVIHKKEIIKSIPLTTDSFAFQAEALIKSIKSGHSFVQVGMYLQEREYGKSKAFKLKNILGVIRTVLRLLWKIYVQENLIRS